MALRKQKSSSSGRRKRALDAAEPQNADPVKRAAKARNEAEDTQPAKTNSVFGLSWVGIRTDKLNAMCDFLDKGLGLHLVHRCKQDHAIYQADNGDFVALYGPSTSRYELFDRGAVLGFRVGNIVAARAQLAEAGIAFIGPTHSRENGRWKYAHFRGPDGAVYELVEESPWPDLPG